MIGCLVWELLLGKFFMWIPPRFFICPDMSFLSISPYIRFFTCICRYEVFYLYLYRRLPARFFICPDYQIKNLPVFYLDTTEHEEIDSRPEGYGFKSERSL